MKERILWVDFLKATLIFLMVLGHSSQQGIVGDVLSSFHMPAFFMVSGFLYHSRTPKKLLRSFVYPFLIYSFLWVLKMQFVSFYTEGHLIDGYFKKLLFGMITSDLSLDVKSFFPGYWFLIVLLIIRLLSGDVKDWGNMNSFRMLLSLGIIVFYGILLEIFPTHTRFISNIFLIKAIVCMPFFNLGLFIRERNNEKLFNLNLYVILLLFIFSILMSHINGAVNLMLSDYGKCYFLFIINTLPMTLVLINIFNRFSKDQSAQRRIMNGFKSRIESIAITISEGTLLILGMHGIIIGFFKMIFQNTLFWTHPMRPLCTACFVMLVCYPLILISKKYMPLLLGK